MHSIKRPYGLALEQRSTKRNCPITNTSPNMLNTMSRSGVASRSTFSGAQTSTSQKAVATTRRGRVNAQQVFAIKDGATLNRPLRVAVIGGELRYLELTRRHNINRHTAHPVAFTLCVTSQVSFIEFFHRYMNHSVAEE